MKPWEVSRDGAPVRYKVSGSTPRTIGNLVLRFALSPVVHLHRAQCLASSSDISDLCKELYPDGLPKTSAEVRIWPPVSTSDPCRSPAWFLPMAQYPPHFEVKNFPPSLVKDYWEKYDTRRVEQEQVKRHLRERENEAELAKKVAPKVKTKTRTSIPDYTVEEYEVSNPSDLRSDLSDLSCRMRLGAVNASRNTTPSVSGISLSFIPPSSY